MKKNYIAALAACIHLGATCARAQESNLNDDVVVVVTKRAKPGSMVGSAYSRIDEAEIQRSQSVSLTQALSTLPGVLAVDAGGRGSYSQFSIRGNTQAQTLYLVDGIRVNTGMSQDAKTFLSPTSTMGIANIEVARGPQSTLYGSDGIGGVISMESTKGKGKPTITIDGEIGSFTSFREAISSRGEINQLAYSVSYQKEDTANNRPHNDFSNNGYALRLDYDINKDLSLRLNYRGHSSEYQNPTYLGLEQVESNLVSLIADLRINDQWSQKLTLGSYFDRYNWVPSVEESANYSIEWMNCVQIHRNNVLTSGVEFNYQTAETSQSNNYTTNWALYLQDEWELIKNLNITSGLRYDNYKLAGDIWTYRFTGAYLFAKSDTKIRASYGTAFQAPNLRKLYSLAPYEIGNPNLKPETSRGWDAGFDQYLIKRKLIFSATYFRNDIRNLMDYDSTTSAYVNRIKAKNSGVELALNSTFFKDWKSRLSYTYTNSTYESSNESIRRGGIPRQQFGLDSSYCLFKKWTIGCGATILLDREDRFTTYTDVEDYFTARVYSRYEHNDHFAIFGRVENVTNTNYQYFGGEPALPIGFYGGVELKF